MSISKEKIEQITQYLVDEFGDDYPWRWEEDKNLRLSEFASNKKDKIFSQLEKLFEHQWNRKSIKRAPHNLQLQLGELAKLKEQQVLFTSPANESRPMLLAIWWPWGHGGTVSLRLTVLNETYQASEIKPEKDSFLEVIKKLFS